MSEERVSSSSFPHETHGDDASTPEQSATSRPTIAEPSIGPLWEIPINTTGIVERSFVIRNMSWVSNPFERSTTTAGEPTTTPSAVSSRPPAITKAIQKAIEERS
jgi:hypothetical protein